MNNGRTRRSDLDIHPVLNERYSPRAFSDRDVTDAELELLLEAARWAPSSHNEQPWRFLVTRMGQEGHEALLSSLIGSNLLWADKAPVLVLNMVMRDFSHNNKANYHAWHDLGGALAQLTAQATSMGIGLHQLAGFHSEVARVAFNIPLNMELVSVLAIGYPGDPETLEGGLRERELHRSSRKPLTELVRYGRM
jgi:nitroreductase